MKVTSRGHWGPGAASDLVGEHAGQWHQCTQDRSCSWWDGWSTAACPARAQDVRQAPQTQPRPRSCAPLPAAEARTPSPGRCTRAWSSSRLTSSFCCLGLMPLPVRFSLRRLRDETSGKQDHPRLQTKGPTLWLFTFKINQGKLPPGQTHCCSVSRWVPKAWDTMWLWKSVANAKTDYNLQVVSKPIANN